MLPDMSMKTTGGHKPHKPRSKGSNKPAGPERRGAASHEDERPTKVLKTDARASSLALAAEHSDPASLPDFTDLPTRSERVTPEPVEVDSQDDSDLEDGLATRPNRVTPEPFEAASQHDIDLEDKVRDKLSEYLSQGDKPAFGAPPAYPTPPANLPFSEIYERDQEIAALKVRCIAMQAELKAKDNEIKTKDDAYDNLYENFRTLRIQFGDTEIEAVRYKKARKKALAEVDKKEAAIGEMVASNAKAFFNVNEKKAGLRLELVRYEGYFKEAGEEIDDLNDERTSFYGASEEVGVVEAENSDLKAQIGNLKAQCTTFPKTDKVKELERKLCALEDQKNVEIDELKAQKMAQTEEYNTEKAKYEKELNKFNRAVFDLHWKFKVTTGQAEELAEHDSDADAMDVDGESKGEGDGDGTMLI